MSLFLCSPQISFGRYCQKKSFRSNTEIADLYGLQTFFAVSFYETDIFYISFKVEGN